MRAGANFTGQMYQAASDFAKTAGDVAGAAGKAADALVKVKDYASAGRDKITSFASDVDLIVTLFSTQHKTSKLKRSTPPINLPKPPVK
jgi:hypothetical protein